MLFACLLLISCAFYGQATVTGSLDSDHEYKLLSVLTTAFTKLQPGDEDNIYYGIRGFNMLNKPLITVLKKDSCAHINNHFKKNSAPEVVFHVLSAWTALECGGTIHTGETITALKSALNKPSTTGDIRFAVEALKLLKEAVPAESKLATALQQLLKADDSLLSIGNALHAGALLGANGKFMQNRIEDVVVQADEIDGKMLQFEGGLTLTSLLLTGIYKYPGVKPLTQEQSDKFATYLLSRHSVQSPKGVVALLEAIQTLSSTSVAPVSITVVDNGLINADKPELNIKVTDLFGKTLKTVPSPVVAQTVTRTSDNTVVLSKQTLSAGTSVGDYVLPVKLEPGQYRVAISAGSHQSTFMTRILGPIKLDWLEIGTGDTDGTSTAKLTKIQYPNKMETHLQADSTQMLIAKFPLSRSVHQAFLRLHTGPTEIVFIAEKDNSNMYKLNVNLAAELSFSGTFDMELIIGDALISNPIRWNLGAIEVKLGSTETPKPPVLKGPKPEIKHMFRVADKRPPQGVSLLFTLAALAPLLLLPILWLKVGFNLKNFNFFSVPFHFGLATIFALFTCFWLELNMFMTCAYLIPIGLFTFLSGNRMLRKIAKH